MKPIFIAEVKIKSPFGFESQYSWEQLFELAAKHGDWLSIHTEYRWGGNKTDIHVARRYTNKRILAKGIHDSDKDVELCLSLGANYVLVVDRLPDKSLVKRCLIECSNLNFLRDCVQKHPDVKYVYNARSLTDGFPKKLNEFPDFRKETKWLCQASFISKPNDINPEVDAFIVGEKLVEYCNCLKYTKPENLQYPTGKESLQSGKNSSGRFRTLGTQEEREFHRKLNKQLINDLKDKTNI